MANDRFWRIVLKKSGWRETQAASAHGGEEAFLLFLANALQGPDQPAGAKYCGGFFNIIGGERTIPLYSPFRKRTSVPMEGLLDSDVRIIENARDRAAPKRTHGGVGAMVVPHEAHCLLECPSNTTLPPKIFNLKAVSKGRPSLAV